MATPPERPAAWEAGRASSRCHRSNRRRGVWLLPKSVMRRLDALGDLSRAGTRVNGLLRLLDSPVVWLEAYANIYANKGATTRGVTPNTLEGCTDERVGHLQTLLKEHRYRPPPGRRVYSPKSDGRKRPLGTSTGDEKLVPEGVRLLLERLYEPIFSDQSHGCRPKRSPHTALSDLKPQWTGVKGLGNVDIAGFYDNIDHQVLLSLLADKIDDKRFLQLMRLMLQAGSLEAWQFQATYSGTPQGHIASPILANLSLHALDRFMEEETARVNPGRRRAPNVDYRRLTNRLSHLRKHIDVAQEQGDLPQAKEMQAEIKRLDQARKGLSSVEPWDANFRRLWYCRYAAEMAIGVIGSKADAKGGMEKGGDYLKSALRLDRSREKAGIIPARQGMTCLGDTVQTYARPKIVRTKRANTRYTTQQAISEPVVLGIPGHKSAAFMRTQRDTRNGTALHRAPGRWRSEADIMLGYNAAMSGVANSYGLVHNAPRG